MRILTVGNMYPPHHLGGYELAWESWTRHAEARGHTVRVLTTDFRLEPTPGESDADAAHRELRWYWREHGFPRLRGWARWSIEGHNARVLETHLRAFRPDAVAWWAMGGMSLSLIERVRRAGIPSVSMVCDDWLLYAPKVDAWTRAFANRPRLAWLAERAGAITSVNLASGPHLFLSYTLRRRAAEALPAVSNSEVIHRGPDADLVRRTPAREWAWKLLYAGRIDPRKGIEIAIRALPRLPESATLTVDGAGDSEHLAHLKQVVAAEGLETRVRFCRTPRADLGAAYADADAVVFPVTWAEPWGLVPLEAMAVGRPVIATGLGGSGEYLEHGENCLLFDASRGAEELARRVRELEADPNLRARLREGGFRTEGSLSVERFNARVLAAVEEVGPPGGNDTHAPKLD